MLSFLTQSYASLRVAMRFAAYSVPFLSSLFVLACSSSDDDPSGPMGGAGAASTSAGTASTTAGNAPVSAGTAGTSPAFAGAPPSSLGGAGGNGGAPSQSPGGTGPTPTPGGAPSQGGTGTEQGTAGTVSVAGSASGGAAGGGSTPAPGCGDQTGFYVEEGKLFDKNCNEFVMRGVNYPYVWYKQQNLQQDLAAIAATGANAVRLVLATGGRWPKTTASELTTLINASKAAKLVPVLEVHDITGYAEQAESVPLSNAVSYWSGADILNALKGTEASAIINIANEPNGNDTSDTWAATHVSAVQALRTAGYTHTLIVDAPNWGQDWENSMRDGGGASIWEADTLKNLIFSVHMYDEYKTAQRITSYFNTFLDRYEAPLIVGEFAADHGADKNVDEDTIMSLAETLGIGYLGWSWSGNGSGLESLDIVQNFNASSLTTWGTRLVNGMNGLKATGAPCTCLD